MNPELYLPKEMFPTGLTKIGDGADGTVYETISKEIVKVSVFLNWDNQDIYQVQKNILGSLKYIEKSEPQHLVKISEIGSIIYITKFRSIHGDLDAFIYSYKMERLNHLSDDEKRVFESISHRDSGNHPEINKKTFEMTERLCDFYELDFKKTSLFLKSIATSHIIHLDIHPRNIMKDNDNNYKLIDLDRITITYS